MDRKPNSTILLMALLIAWSSCACFAEELDAGKMASMPLEELLQVRTTSTTRSGTFTARRSPGVVRVFTRADIDRFGFRTIGDILMNIPGMQIQEYRGGHQSVSVRGIPSRYNNKILLLIDGVPIRDSYYGHTSVQESVPMDMVERIEIITGPGGVLYGSNAFVGVIAVTTRKHGRSASVEGGTYDTRIVGAEFDQGPVYGFGQWGASSGFHPALNSDGQKWDHPQDSERRFGLLKMSGKHLDAAVSYSRDHYADTYRGGTRDRFWSRSPIYGSLRYKRTLTSGVQLTTSGFYENYSVEKAETQYKSQIKSKATTEEIDTSLYGAEVEASIDAESHNIIVAASLLGDRSPGVSLVQSFPAPARTAGLIVPNVNRTDVGVMVQDVWSLSDALALTVGLRYDALSDFSDPVSYRVGLTGERGSMYGKLLLGTAYRVPSFREYLDIASYNLSLKPEFLRTFEAQIGTVFSKGDLSLTFYDNSYTDLIRELPVSVIRTPAG